MPECYKRYPYMPLRERTQELHDKVCARFYELRRREFEIDEQRARYLPNLYYIDRLSDEFCLSPSYVRNIINWSNRNG